MLAFISNLSPGEMVVVVVLAVIIFGRQLPDVTMELARRFYKLRKMLSDLRRETGIDEELREVQRSLSDIKNIDTYAPQVSSRSTAKREPAKPATEPAEAERSPGYDPFSDAAGGTPGPGSGEAADEPAGDQVRRGGLAAEDDPEGAPAPGFDPFDDSPVDGVSGPPENGAGRTRRGEAAAD